MDNTHCCSLRNKKKGERTHVAHRRKRSITYLTERRQGMTGEKQKHLLKTAICIYFNNNKYCTKRRKSRPPRRAKLKQNVPCGRKVVCQPQEQLTTAAAAAASKQCWALHNCLPDSLQSCTAFNRMISNCILPRSPYETGHQFDTARCRLYALRADSTSRRHYREQSHTRNSTAQTAECSSQGNPAATANVLRIIPDNCARVSGTSSSLTSIPNKYL